MSLCQTELATKKTCGIIAFRLTNFIFEAMPATKKKPRNNLPKAISLFSGAGGMDVGVRQAGFEVLTCVEWDPYCCQTLRRNIASEHQSTTVIEGDIREVDPKEVAKISGVRPKTLDLLFGGPPCQTFSLIGKQRGLKDERGLLLFQMARFAEFFQPRVVLLEQVKGLLSAKGEKGMRGEVFQHFLSDLERIGYVPKWRVLLAADYGVPQKRERLFVVATRGVNGFNFPEPTHTSDDAAHQLFGLQPHTSAGDALKGLGKPHPKIKGQTIYDNHQSHVDVTPERDRERIAQVPEGSYLAAQTHLSIELRRGLSPKDTTKYLRAHRKKPSNTLRCGEIFYHPTQNRYLTPREYMRIHGYPDSYQLCGPIRSRTGTVKNLDQHRQVANSVPPPLAKSLGAAIKAYLHEQDI